MDVNATNCSCAEMVNYSLTNCLCFFPGDMFIKQTFGQRLCFFTLFVGFFVFAERLPGAGSGRQIVEQRAATGSDESDGFLAGAVPDESRQAGSVCG